MASAQSVPEGTPVHIATTVVPPPAPTIADQITLPVVLIFLGFVLVVLQIWAIIKGWLKDDKKENRDRVDSELREVRSDHKELEKRVYEGETQRSKDRERVSALEKDMGYIKAGQDRIEKSVEKLIEVIADIKEALPRSH